MKNTENEYQTLLRQKEELIKQSGASYAAKVFELSEQEGALKAYITELDEAIFAGRRVERALSDAIAALEKAQNWATWDLFGGGTISDIAKHQKIDQAEAYLRQAQTNMRQFQKELLDVKQTALPEVNISGMLKFADFFFDGFISDYLVQGKINNSLDQTKHHYNHVGDILTNLELQSERKRKKLEQIHHEKQVIVESL
ncbi:hypothetical protein [Bacillus sp. JJ1764]|uniref:hypothetical protein n=1 Tax=Bacillus sp. JJ1764 TaxID=3122964 RepID=UPI002FFE6DA4